MSATQREKAQGIFELPKKVADLFVWAEENGLMELKGQNALAETIKIPRSTLASNLAVHKMAPSVQQKLAAVFGFDVNWLEWIDKGRTSSGQRKDTAAAFIARFRSTKNTPSTVAIHAKTTSNHLLQRLVNFQLQPVDAPGSILGLSLSISFTANGWPHVVDGHKVTIGLLAADLEFVQSSETGSISVKEVRCASENDGNFRGYVEGLGDWWRFRSHITDEPFLRGRVTSNDVHCNVSGFRIGDVLKARLMIRIDDCDFIAGHEVVQHPDRARAAIMQQFLKIAALDGVETVLAEQILTIVSTP